VSLEKIKEFLRLMRPKQWFKSFYIVLGSIPAIFLMPVRFDLIVFYLFIGIFNMILLQGVIYTLNDIADLKEDKAHPTKKFRPIASGKISVKEGLLFASFLLAVALLIGYLVDLRLCLINIFILINNLLYNFKPIRFRDRKFLDIATSALNFPLRVMVGWYLFEPFNEARFTFEYSLTSIKIASNSIQSIFFNAHPLIFSLSVKFSSITLSFISMMLITYFTAVFLLSMKRLAEKNWLKKPETFRKVLKKYSMAELKLISIFSMLIVFLSFIIFAFSLKPILVLLSPLALYAFYLYYKLAFLRSDLVSRPETIFTKITKFTMLIAVFGILGLILLFLW
jgi:4-hydroxybenzoate polyprenyltransferase